MRVVQNSKHVGDAAEAIRSEVGGGGIENTPFTLQVMSRSGIKVGQIIETFASGRGGTMSSAVPPLGLGNYMSNRAGRQGAAVPQPLTPPLPPRQLASKILLSIYKKAVLSQR